MKAIPAPIRRLLRPLAPWRLRGRLLRRRLGRQVRHNVDVVVTGRWRTWRWLATTPATYRVGDPTPEGGSPHGIIAILTLRTGECSCIGFLHHGGLFKSLLIATHSFTPAALLDGQVRPIQERKQRDV